jgi:hypothetical protein
MSDIRSNKEIDVTFVIFIFRESLLAIIPFFEQLRTPWREPEAYDEWDDVASALFNGLVKSSMIHGVPIEETDGIAIADYDLLLDDYSRVSFFSLKHLDNQKGALCLFHSFATALRPLDTIRYRRVGSDGRVLDPRIETCSIEDALFAFQYRTSSGTLRAINILQVE